MNIDRQETQTKRYADKMHEHAQETGIREAYIKAAELYEQCGEWDKARVCREAAERLPK